VWLKQFADECHGTILTLSINLVSVLKNPFLRSKMLNFRANDKLRKNLLLNEMINNISNAAKFGVIGLISAFAIPNILILFEKIKIGKNEK